MILIIIMTGCALVPSNNIVGLKAHQLEASELNGIWINGDSAIRIKVIDPTNGIVNITVFEENERDEKMNIQIMKGKSWLYYNWLFENTDKDKYFYWGRIQISENRIITWHPSNDAFSKAIKEGIIKGAINKDDVTVTEAGSAKLTDSSINIVNMIESSDKSYFLWDDPIIFTKLRK